MKVAIVLASNTISAPYLYYYRKMLEEQQVNFDIILWNKDNVSEDNCITYDESVNLQKSRLFRLTSYLRYSHFVKNVLSNGNYDRVVVCTIFLGVLLSRYLKKNFYKRYFFDIRDYSPFLKYVPKSIGPLIFNAYKTSISSPGFLQWLPPGDHYVISHNYKLINKESVLSTGVTVNIVLTIGLLRDFEVNKILIDSLRESDRFTLKFVGRGHAYIPLLNYVTENKIKNVIFTGEYKKSDELHFLQDVALMNILGGNDRNSKTLLTNRLYLAASNFIPVMVSANTTQAEIVEKYNLGVVISEIDDLEATLSSYLAAFNQTIFEEKCKLFLEDIAKDQRVFEATFIKFLSNEAQL